LLVEVEQSNKYKKKSRNADPAWGAIVLLLEHASAAFHGAIVRMASAKRARARVRLLSV
jgi:hypothetical protein